MSADVCKELPFKAAIGQELLESGWHQGAPGFYRADLGLDLRESEALVGRTQMKAFEEAVTAYGDRTSGDRSPGAGQAGANQDRQAGALDVSQRVSRGRVCRFGSRTSGWSTHRRSSHRAVGCHRVSRRI
jgi:hypothetical protein